MGIGHQLGADRDTLITLYQTFILSKIQYGAAVYGTASPTVLRKLDTVQHTALRIALGAFVSTPVAGLHAESGLLPLASLRDMKMCLTLYKASTSSSTHLVTDHLAHILTFSEEGHLSSLPVLMKALLLLRDASLPVPTTPTSALSVSPLPPWHDLDSSISLDFGFPYCKGSAPPRLAQQLFLQLHHTRYSSYTPVFTDGSRCPGRGLTTSATYFPSLRICRTWRLSSDHTVVAAELFAILQALEPLKSLAPDSVVIYSDSRSGLSLLRTCYPGKYHLLVFKIHELLLQLLSQGWTISLQWVPSHAGIEGNEVVDRATRLDVPATVEFLQLELSEAKSLVAKALHRQWDTTLAMALQTTALGELRSDSSPSPWVRFKNRRLDVAFLRLRIGHCGLQAHRHRLRLVDSASCIWCSNLPETVEHFLLFCPRFHGPRTSLRSRLSALGVRRFTLAILLDGAGFDPPLRRQILSETARFLSDTRQLSRL